MSMNIQEIMAQQFKLMSAMGWPGGAPKNEEAAKGHLLAAIHECTEAMNELNWKPWKSTAKEVDRVAFATELMDIVQFVANAALVMDFEAAELEAALRVKWKENYRRIEAREVTSEHS